LFFFFFSTVYMFGIHFWGFGEDIYRPLMGIQHYSGL
jgi:hypothetical protein